MKIVFCQRAFALMTLNKNTSEFLKFLKKFKEKTLLFNKILL